MLRNDANAMCSLCLRGDHHLQVLVEKECTDEYIVDVTGSILLMAVLEVLGKLTLADATKSVALSATKSTIWVMLGAIKSFSLMDAWLPPKHLCDDIQFLTSFIDPASVCIKQLAADLSRIETMPTSESKSAGGKNKTVLEFLLDGTVGLRLIANAEAMYKTRKSEIECEDLLEDMNCKYNNVLLSKPFYDAEKHCVLLESFDGEELKAFFDTASQSAKELEDLPASKKKSGPLGKSPAQRAADMQAELWASLKANFKAMYKAVIEDVMGLAVEALQNDGADRFGALVDFAELESLVDAKCIATSPHRESPYAKHCKFGQTVDDCVQKGKLLVAATKFVLTTACPRVAALNEVTATDSDVKRYASILDQANCYLANFEIDGVCRAKFCDAFAPKIQSIVEARGSVVFDHVRQTIDVAIGSPGKASGLTEQAVKDLTKRLPQTSPYESFVMDLLMSRVLIDQVEESFSAKIAADILARLTHAKSWLSAWKAEHGDAASLFFERGRFDAIEVYLDEKTNTAAASVHETSLDLITELERTLAEISALAGAVEVHDKTKFCEEKFMTIMRNECKEYAQKQKKVEKLVAQLEQLFEGASNTFAGRSEHQDALMGIGCVVYIIALYTATTLYRSPLLGKKTTVGKKTLDNLKKVLDSINALQAAVKVEIAFDLALLKEIRDFAQVPCAKLPAEGAPSVVAATAGNQTSAQPAASVANAGAAVSEAPLMDAAPPPAPPKSSAEAGSGQEALAGEEPAAAAAAGDGSGVAESSNSLDGVTAAPKGKATAAPKGKATAAPKGKAKAKAKAKAAAEAEPNGDDSEHPTRKKPRKVGEPDAAAEEATAAKKPRKTTKKTDSKELATTSSGIKTLTALGFLRRTDQAE